MLVANRLLPVDLVGKGDWEKVAFFGIWALAMAHRLQAAFTAPWTRIYHSGDMTGVELAGACKNVIAIAAGVVDGMGLGMNTKSALLARGLAEIARVGVALGGRIETFFGVAGVGELATTCFAPEGRNRSFGERLAREPALEPAAELRPSRRGGGECGEIAGREIGC